MKIKKIGKISSGQDGAIRGDLLFRFDEKGNGTVYDLSDISENSRPVGAFNLDPTGKLLPHVNAAMFGTEYAESDDEFPALYVNVYNNYADAKDPLKGVSCVYRITREGAVFSASLIQLIEIGFTENASLWKASEEKDGPRPYGNFAIDRERGRYYAFTMRNETLGTRYFAFSLPALADGKWDDTYGVYRVTLEEKDILSYFDCPFHRYIQGASLKDGKIYSLEGFGESAENPPALRVIDLINERQESCTLLADFGLSREPEFIDFTQDGACYYADNPGNLYLIEN